MNATTTRVDGATRRGRARRATALLGLAALISVTAACGSRWNDEERAFVYSGRDRTSDEAADDTTSDEQAGELAPGDTVPGDVATGGTTGGTGGTTATGGTGGTTGGTTGGASGPKACAATSSAPGVTDDTITVGTISTLTGPVPGLGETSEAAVALLRRLPQRQRRRVRPQDRAQGGR